MHALFKIIRYFIEEINGIYEAIKSNTYLKVNKFFISYLYFVTNFLDRYSFTLLVSILFLFVDHFFSFFFTLTGKNPVILYYLNKTFDYYYY